VLPIALLAQLLFAIVPSGAPCASELPRLDHEPLLRVLIARAPEVPLELLEPAWLVRGAGERVRVDAGRHVVAAAAGGWRLDGGPVLRERALLDARATPAFALEATPRFGAKRRLVLGGDLFLQADGGEVLVIERVPMEDYLASTVGAEMSPNWPPQALAAQAIVARSYAAARWMERDDEPWHLHWHFGVDMAYHGVGPGDAEVARAIRPTRGEVLVHRGFPVLALFHASSGGRTESFRRVKPGVFAPDGRTPIAGAMPVVVDQAALRGAAGLGLSDSHGGWRCEVELAEVTRALADWAAEGEGRPRFGAVEGVSILERHDDSGRAATLAVRHRVGGERELAKVDAAAFRLALGPVRVRSLFWERCVVEASGRLVIEGRGFGHGCGLSQVSAWYLATKGLSAEEIVARFYAGSRIERRY